MRFNCDNELESAIAKERMQREWHKSFAWLPVKVAYGDCRWLERVERMRLNKNCLWNYRAVDRS